MVALEGVHQTARWGSGLAGARPLLEGYGDFSTTESPEIKRLLREGYLPSRVDPHERFVVLYNRETRSKTRIDGLTDEQIASLQKVMRGSSTTRRQERKAPRRASAGPPERPKGESSEHEALLARLRAQGSSRRLTSGDENAEPPSFSGEPGFVENPSVLPAAVVESPRALQVHARAKDRPSAGVDLQPGAQGGFDAGGTPGEPRPRGTSMPRRRQVRFRDSQLATARDRMLRLFQFLQGFNQLRNPVLHHVDQLDFKLWGLTHYRSTKPWRRAGSP